MSRMPKTELTRSEIKVGLELMEGLSDKDIASDLGWSYQTVKNTMSKIMTKTGTENRVALALHFARNPQKLGRGWVL